MLQEGEDGSDQVREQQVPPASVEEQLWELWLGGGVDALEATISKFDEKFAAATLHYGGTSLRIVGLATRMRISKTIRTADIDGTSENNRALGRGRLQKVRLLMYFWTTDIAGTSENNRALVDISGRAYLVEAHDSGVGNFVRLSAGYRYTERGQKIHFQSRQEHECDPVHDDYQKLNFCFLRTKASAGESSEASRSTCAGFIRIVRCAPWTLCGRTLRSCPSSPPSTLHTLFMLLLYKRTLFFLVVVEGGMDEMDDTVDDGDWTEGMMDEMYGDPLDACDRQQRQSSIPRSTCVTYRHLDDTHVSRGQVQPRPIAELYQANTRAIAREQLCCMPRLDTFLLCGQALSNNTTRNIASANEFLASICNNPFLDIVAIHGASALVPTSVISLVPTSVISYRVR
ncbi:hypothetical protein B0H14DRAFT_2611214 [Mycena olivaceomarginata]|nr:hypothetical protein B0H14DRAFT_2611214 [Mycena olivaceomarginata]